MGNVNFSLDADSAKAVAGFLKIVDAQKKVDKGAAKNKRTTSEFSKSVGKELNSMVGQWLTVGAAIAGVRKGITLISEEMKRLDQLNRKTTMSVTEQIAAAGDMAQGAHIRQFLASGAFRGSGLSPEEAGRLYGAIRGGAPGERLDRVMGLTAQLAGTKRAGLSPEGGEGMGTLMGGLATAAPTKSAGDIADLAAMITQGQGRYENKITRGGLKAVQQWTAAGLGTTDTAVDMLMASVQAQQGSEAFQALVDRLGTDQVMAPLKPGRRMTATEKAERGYWSAPKAGRLAMLRGDAALRAKILGTTATGVEAMFDRFGRTRGMAAAAQRSDAWQTMQSAVLRDKAYAEEIAIEEQIALEARNAALKDTGASQRYQRYHAAKLQARGTNVIFRAASQASGQFAEAIGINTRYGAEDEMQAAADDIRSAAAGLNAVTGDLRKVTAAIPHQNAHTE